LDAFLDAFLNAFYWATNSLDLSSFANLITKSELIIIDYN